MNVVIVENDVNFVEKFVESVENHKFSKGLSTYYIIKKMCGKCKIFSKNI